MKMTVNNNESTIRHLGDFLNIINVLYEHYSVNRGKQKFLFRGQTNIERKLIPSIYHTRDGSSGEKRYYSAEPAKSERNLIDAFKRLAIPYLPHIDFDDHGRWMIYARHFGVPVRTLDFSFNPLVALYFACEDGLNPKYDKDGVVWVIFRDKYQKWAAKGVEMKDPKEKFIHSKSEYRKAFIDAIMHEIGYIIDECPINKVKNPMVRIYPFIDKRMEAQASIYLLWGSQQIPLDEMLESDGHPCFDSFTSINWEKNIEDSHILFKIVIPFASKYKLLKELDRIGINKAVLFPCLDGFGKWVAESYEIFESDIKNQKLETETRTP